MNSTRQMVEWCGCKKNSAQFADTHTHSHTEGQCATDRMRSCFRTFSFCYPNTNLSPNERADRCVIIQVTGGRSLSSIHKHVYFSLLIQLSSQEIYGNFHFGCFENGALLGAILSDGRINVEPIDCPPPPHRLKLCVSFSDVCSHWLLCADRGTPILSD